MGKEQIINFLQRNNDRKWTAREIICYSGLNPREHSYAPIYRALADLRKENKCRCGQVLCGWEKTCPKCGTVVEAVIGFKWAKKFDLVKSSSYNIYWWS